MPGQARTPQYVVCFTAEQTFEKKNQKINIRRQEGAAAHNVRSAYMLRHYISRTQKTMRMRICMLLFGC